MRIHPQIYSLPMVHAQLDGRKGMTRRLLKLPTKSLSGGPIYEHSKMGGWEPTTIGGGGCFTFGKGGEKVPEPEKVAIWHQTCGSCIVAPYQPGDLIYVRETHWRWGRWVKDAEGKWRFIFRRADKPVFKRVYGSDIGRDRADPRPHWWKRPAIYHFRDESRLTLEVTAVKIERLQDITEADAIAEGLKPLTKDGKLVKYGIPDSDGLPGTDDDGWAWQDWHRSPVAAFEKLWDGLNAKRAPWDSNPWVVAISFNVIKKNVDEVLAARSSSEAVARGDAA